MNKHRIGALFAALALTLTFAGTALADGTVDWDGSQGITDGDFTTLDCKDGAGILWIFNAGPGNTVTAASINVDGEVVQGTESGGVWKFMTSFQDAADIGSATVSFTGSLGSPESAVVLTISHACEGTTTTTTTSDETTSTTTTDETTSTTTSDETTSTTTSDETTSTTTSDETTSTTSNETTPAGSVEELTPPRTDAIAQPTSSSTVSTGLLLVLAGILAAALVVIPAAARSRR